MIEKAKKYGVHALALGASLLAAAPAFAAELFAVPDLNNLVASTSPTVTGSFYIFAGIAFFLLGFFIGIAILIGLVRVLRGGVSKVLGALGGGRRGGRRRRR